MRAGLLGSVAVCGGVSLALTDAFATLLGFFIRLGLTVCLAQVFGSGVIWWSFVAGWAVATLVTVARYMQGGWRIKGVA